MLEANPIFQSSKAVLHWVPVPYVVTQPDNYHISWHIVNSVNVTILQHQARVLFLGQPELAVLRQSSQVLTRWTCLGTYCDNLAAWWGGS